MPPDEGKVLARPDPRIEKRRRVTELTSNTGNRINSHQTIELRHNQQISTDAELHTKALLTRPTKRKHDARAVVPTSSKPAWSAHSTALNFYPAYCHSASPTSFTWVKLTAQDIHNKLQEREGYQHVFQTGHPYDRSQPKILFYLNHPIQFVQIVGVVVSYEEFFEKFWLFTIDDSSGATIDVVCKKPRIEKDQGVHAWDGAATVTKHTNTEEDAEAEKETFELSRQVEAVSIGLVLQVKGIVTVFRRHKASSTAYNTNHVGRTVQTSTAYAQENVLADQAIRQISLSRLSVVHSTTAEMSLINARVDFRRSVLSNPWILTQKEIQKLHRKALGEVEHERSKVTRRRDKDVKRKQQEEQDADQLRAEYEEEDKLRSHEASLSRRAGEHLRMKQQQRQELNNSAVVGVSLVTVDEKSALLRAAFG